MAETVTNVPGTENTAEEPEKTFTQTEVDALIARRLERERKKYPGEEELNAFRSWREDRQNDRNALEALTRERDGARSALSAAQAELERMKRERFLTEKGVPEEDVDYCVFKIGKLAEDGLPFEQAAEAFLREQGRSRVRLELGAGLSGGGRAGTANEEMNAMIRGARASGPWS